MTSTDALEPVDLSGSSDGDGVPGAPVLSVRDLTVEFKTDDGLLRAVDHVSFDVLNNETLGIVGESGSGKSVTSLAILGLLPRSARVTGEVLFKGEPLLGLPEKQLERVRGARIAMVFQDALAALNPVQKVGAQIGEAISVHENVSSSDRRARVLELLEIVGIPSPSQRIDHYPHEYSGGMRQRAMIAMAIANDPDLLIADEPTTALDVTIQAQVLEVLERIQERTKSSIMLITHDLGVVAGVADRVQVMYAGRPVERGTVDELFYDAASPVHGGVARVAATAGPAVGQEQPAAPDQGAAAVADLRAARVCVPSAVPDGAGARCVQHRAPGAARDLERSLVGVSLRRGSRRGQDGGAGRGTTGRRGARAVTSVSPAPEPSVAPGPPPVLEVVDLVKNFPIRAGLFRHKVGDVQAVSGVSFSVGRAETLGLVGESGCGKSTTGRCVLRLIEPTSGSVRFNGNDVLAASSSEMRDATGGRCRSSSRTRTRR